MKGELHPTKGEIDVVSYSLAAGTPSILENPGSLLCPKLTATESIPGVNAVDEGKGRKERCYTPAIAPYV